MGNTLNLVLNNDQVAVVRGYQKRGDWSGMYDYLASQVNAGGGDPRLSNWFSSAADINSGNGFLSDFVRGATSAAGYDNGDPITAQEFQNASNYLANQVATHLIRGDSLSINTVTIMDQAVGMTRLGLSPDQWGGSIGGLMPLSVGGLGMSPDTFGVYQRINNFYNKNGVLPLDRAENFFDLAQNDMQGVLSGMQDLWRNDVADLDDLGTLADPGFYKWAADQLFQSIKDMMGDVQDPDFWHQLADQAIDKWRGLEHGIGNIWDEWFAPLWHKAWNDPGSLWDRILQEAGLLQNDNTYRVERYDPIVFDLDGDGNIATTAYRGYVGAMFDADGDGVRTASGWITPSDGILVRDLNGNGIIDSGAELFGDQTKITNDKLADNGFAALAALDENQDGVVSTSDSAFGSLRVWRDANGNGITDQGELLTLDALGITSVSVDYQKQHVSVDGGELVGTGSYTRVKDDGTTVTGLVGDFNFNNDTIHSEYVDHVDVPDELADLPGMHGMGKLRNLREACALSPDLAATVREFATATSRKDQRALMGRLLTEWAKTCPDYREVKITVHASGGVEDPNSSNVIRLRPGESVPMGVTMLPEGSLDKLWVVQEVLGRGPINDIWWGPGNLEKFMDIYDTFYEGVYEKLALQTRLKAYVSDVKLIPD